MLRLRREHLDLLERFDELQSTIARSEGGAAIGSAVRAAARLVRILERRLPGHFADEERNLPAPPPDMPDEHAAIDAALANLVALRHRAERGEDERAFIEATAAFVEQLTTHIGGEERQMRSGLAQADRRRRR